MAKEYNVYVCSECSNTEDKWMGQCPECNAWGTLEEKAPIASSSGKKNGPNKTTQSAFTPKNAVAISSQSREVKKKIPTKIEEFDRVLGGGLMPGGIVLLTGSPGCGKSTLTLAAAHNLAKNVHKTLIVSGEETENQIADRAIRIGAAGSENLYIVSDKDLSNTMAYVDNLNPDVIIIDSLQTMYSSNIDGNPGGVSQVKEVASTITSLGKGKEIPVIVIGHVTKDEKVAGPRTVEHLVDTVLLFSDAGTGSLKLLRANKNRFGSIEEVGCFEHHEGGLKEVKDPSGILLDQHDGHITGIGISITMEGNRPLPVEVQALTVTSAIPVPRRVASGVEHARAIMLQAVLDKHARLGLGNMDIYVSTAGGIKVRDTSLDIATAIALCSSKYGYKLSPKLVGIGEVSLTGELRRVSYMERRIEEAYRLGLDLIIVPKTTEKSVIESAKKKGIAIVPIDNVNSLVQFVANLSEQ